MKVDLKFPEKCMLSSYLQQRLNANMEISAVHMHSHILPGIFLFFRHFTFQLSCRLWVTRFSKAFNPGNTYSFKNTADVLLLQDAIICIFIQFCLQSMLFPVNSVHFPDAISRMRRRWSGLLLVHSEPVFTQGDLLRVPRDPLLSWMR